MRRNLDKQGQAYRILWFGDAVALSGFGRIGNEICRRLHQRGYAVQMAGISYNGWPHDLPFWVWPLAGQDLWNGLVGIVNTYRPDVLVSCQDFPYHQTIWHGCRIDFSRTRWVWITPIDGTPVHPDWVKLAEVGDGKLVISRFGVEALRQAGQRVGLCHPGVDATEFYPAAADEKQQLRALAGFDAGDYVIGVVCMNQGRKAIPAMIAAFGEFARDKPEARLYLDMDKGSPAGWDIPNLLRQMGWSEADQKRVHYKEDVWKHAAETSGQDQHGLLPLRNRYALMDAHMVISHREGFGLPLLESMACKVPTLALDWCSGTEICGEGRGMLVDRIPYMEHGTWGGAKDAFPDLADLVGKLNTLYHSPETAAHVARTGHEWAVQQTWDRATDAVEDAITAALARPRSLEPNGRDPQSPNPAPGLADVYGPAAEPVGDRPGLQRPGAGDPLPAEPGADAGRDGAAAPGAEGGAPGPG